MAKVYSAPSEWGWDVFEFKPSQDWKEHNAACQKKLDEIHAQYPVIRFPVGDGYAMYAVYKMKPLQLIHIPYGDAYDADPILLRGLNRNDVEQMIERKKAVAKLFGRAEA